MTPELHRPLATNRIGPGGLEITVQASDAECAALAQRMRLPALLSLACRFHLSWAGGDIVHARGWLSARVVQTCIITMDDFEALLQETFAVNFVPAARQSDQVDPEAEDEIPYFGDTLDLGEAAAQQLGLALDPYPRQPGAELPRPQADESPSPFTELGGRRHLH